MNIQHLGKIDHIDIYFDPQDNKNTVLFGRKGKELSEKSPGFSSPSYIFIPYKNKAWDMETSEKPVYQYKPKYKDYDFCIGSFSTLEFYQRAINNLKKSCQK